MAKVVVDEKSANLNDISIFHFKVDLNIESPFLATYSLLFTNEASPEDCGVMLSTARL